MKRSAKMTPPRPFTRREFLSRTLATTTVLASAPAFLRGQNLNNKLNIAFIACGGRGNANLAELTVVPGRTAPKGRKAASDTGGPESPHPDENVTVLCDIDQRALDSASQRYPRARTFTDLRRVFDRPNDFDAVVTFCSSGNTPMGFAYGLRYSVYTPTSNEFANGEACAFVWGMGTCLASSDLFMGASMPTANQTVYAGDNGQMTTMAGSNKKVGVCEAVDVRVTATGGTGGTQSVARIRFDINPYGT